LLAFSDAFEIGGERIDQIVGFDRERASFDDFAFDFFQIVFVHRALARRQSA